MSDLAKLQHEFQCALTNHHDELFTAVDGLRGFVMLVDAIPGDTLLAKPSEIGNLLNPLLERFGRCLEAIEKTKADLAPSSATVGASS
jgi:hypothetical protein